LNRFESRLQHFSNVLAITSGVLFAGTKYFPTYFSPSHVVDEYSRAQSPIEPWMHDAHVLVVPLLIFACGLIWRSHIVPKWNGMRASRRKVPKLLTGLALLIVALPMIATGYLIQVSVSETVRWTFVVIHLATSAIWTLAYAKHAWYPLLHLSKR
jgi:hypothetical protein